MVWRCIVVAVMLLFINSSASAHKHHMHHRHVVHHRHKHVASNPVAQQSFCFFCTTTAPVMETPVHRTSNEGVIGGRPHGCPTQFCGCGASLYLFGRIRPDLNAASSWYRFHRTTPAPRMAAVRPHHVMVLVEHRHGYIWLVHDSNSGHHLTRLHERSIAGYTIVDPST